MNIYRFRHIIKAMIDIERIISESFSDSLEQENIARDSTMSKREFLIDILNQGKKLKGKISWNVDKIEKADINVIKKLYDDYHQNEMRLKAEKTGKPVGKHLINLYSQCISRFLKIDDIDQMCKEIEEDLVIKDCMPDVGEVMVSTFGRFLAPLLLIAHTANHTEGFFSEEEPIVEDIVENKYNKDDL